MLVLSRQIGTSVCIGDDVTVTVLGNNRSHVRLGIQAPRAVPVYREEIYLRIQLERMQAEIDATRDEPQPEIVSTEGAVL